MVAERGRATELVVVVEEEEGHDAWCVSVGGLRVMRVRDAPYGWASLDPPQLDVPVV